MIRYLRLFRFPLVFTAVADSAVGYLLALGTGRPNLAAVLFLAVASGGLYAFGMAMNDVADRKRDGELHPGRVLPSGALAVSGAVGAACVMLGISLGAILLVPRAPLLPPVVLWAAVVGLILAYDFAFKVPPVMGAIRAGNFFLGMAVAPASGDPALWLPWLPLGIPIFVYVTALTFASTLEEGEFRGKTLWMGLAVMAAGALAAPMARKLVGESSRAGVAAVYASCLVAWLAFRAFRARDSVGVRLFVRDGVAGIIVVDAALLASGSGSLVRESALILALLIPVIASVLWFKKLG